MLYVFQLQSLHHTVKQYICNALLFSYFSLQKMTEQHKLYNVQDVIDFVTIGDISDMSDFSDDDSDKDVPSYHL